MKIILSVNLNILVSYKHSSATPFATMGREHKITATAPLEVIISTLYAVRSP